MSKDFEIEAARILAAAKKVDLNNYIEIKTSQKLDNIIKITIPENLEKSIDFNQTLIDLGLPPSGTMKSGKKIRKNSKNSSTYIYFINNNLQEYSIEELNKHLETLEVGSKKVSDVAPFIYKAFLIWNSLPGNLRKHRQITEPIVRGYLKQRQFYSHDQIYSMLETYGKWAKAYQDAMDNNEDPHIFWFHLSNLSQLLLSNRMFVNHLEEGWKQLIIDKKIPKQYSGVAAAKEESDRKKLHEDRAQSYAKAIRNGETFDDSDEVYQILKPRIEEILNESKN